MKRALIATTAAVAWGCAPAPAQAQAQDTPPPASEEVCGTFDAVYADYIGPFAERRLGGGNADAWQTQVWINPDTGSWTILIVWSLDEVCIADAGDGWMWEGAVPPPPQGVPS